MFNSTHSSLDPFTSTELSLVLEAVREGRPIILIDDNNRENEADLIVAAEKITPATMALMIREGSGIVCLCLSLDRIDQLALEPMVSNNESRYGTAFTVSIEARRGVTTGVSALDRVTTIQCAIANDAVPGDIAKPGHVFPLCAHKDGVLGRRGHTEGSVDLAQLAGLKPAAVLCELMNPDGSMARGEQISRFATEYALPIITIEEIAVYRRLQKRRD